MMPLDWVHATTDIPEGGRRVDRAASDAERENLAEALGLVACPMLEASYSVRPLPGGSYRVAGSLAAEVVQPCVVTLEPVTQRIVEPFDVTFSPAAEVPDEPGQEREILSEPEIEPLRDGRIEAGRIVFEHLSSAIDPYPRRPGAELSWSDPADKNESGTSPFAVLSKLKDKG